MRIAEIISTKGKRLEVGSMKNARSQSNELTKKNMCEKAQIRRNISSLAVFINSMNASLILFDIVLVD